MKQMGCEEMKVSHVDSFYLQNRTRDYEVHLLRWEILDQGHDGWNYPKRNKIVGELTTAFTEPLVYHCTVQKRVKIIPL